MLMKRAPNFTKQSSTALLFSSSLFKHHRFFSFASPPPSPTHVVVSGTAAYVADVTGADNLLYTDPPVSSKLATEPTLLQPRVVIYDGVCHLCHGGVKWVIGVDKYRKIKFCCLQSKAAEPYLRLCGLNREDVLRRFLFLEGSGLYHQASTVDVQGAVASGNYTICLPTEGKKIPCAWHPLAALRVMSYLPLPYSALTSLLIIPRPLRDAVYDYVAKRRYDWFGKSGECLVLQEKELLERFIDTDEMVDQT